MASQEPWTQRLREHCLVRGLQEPTYTDLSDRRGKLNPAHQYGTLFKLSLANTEFRRSNSLVDYGHYQREQLPGEVLV
ncbi:hypothetical protein G6011_11259 [Alternaria panax]|uniref:Uncharacterized protein n=1 Tax=Alternaria panax TaxID=48097 RepID=A0AAD4IDG6_9PLEO|nr:hypothetical protein G6011_11259 [Alternaria panax]